jgi:cytidine deaminase
MKFQKQGVIDEIDPDALTDVQTELIERSKAASLRAYAPFSNFNVGCAVLLDNQIIIEGNNQENAAFPSGLCAERVALFYAGAQYPDAKVLKMAVTAISEQFEVPLLLCPCGACLQVISESEQRSGSPIEILLHAHERTFSANGLEQFMPFAFRLLPKEDKPE